MVAGIAMTRNQQSHHDICIIISFNAPSVIIDLACDDDEDIDMIAKILLPLAGAAFTTAQSVKACDGGRDGPFGLGGFGCCGAEVPI
jgi:hypothetical protein